MLSIFAKLTFYSVTIYMLIFFIFNFEQIRVDTNLADLNPNKLNDIGLEYASNALISDINKRFVVLIKGQEPSIINIASKSLKAKLASIPNLKVLSDDEMQSQYLSALRPYRFHLLNDNQQNTLRAPQNEKIVSEAQRKLYTLGEGIRLIPFDEDPLGWFSDYLIDRFDELNIGSSNIDSINEEKDASSHVAFTVYIGSYPDNMASQKKLYNQIMEAFKEQREQSKIQILFSGMFFFAVDSAESAKGDIQLIAIGSTAGVLLLMTLVFRSLLPLCLSLSSIALGVGFGVFVSTITFGSIHILTIVFGASLIGIVVDYSLHYFYHHLSHKNTEVNKRKRTQTLVRAMFLSVLTSLIGYGALGLSELTILKKVALFSCSGLLIAWLGVMVMGPMVAKRPIVARQAFLLAVIRFLQKVFAAYPKAFIGLGLSSAIVGLGFIMLHGVKVNDDPRKFFHVAPALIANEQIIANLTQIYEPGRYVVVTGKTNAEVYSVLDDFYYKMNSRKSDLFSVRDWLPSIASQSENYKLQNTLFKDQGVLDAFYQRLGLSPAQSTKLKTEYRKAEERYLNFSEFSQELISIPPLWIEHEGHIYSFVLLRKNSDFTQIETISDSIKNLDYISNLDDAMLALKEKRIAGTKLLILAYLLIALMLVLYYKKLSIIALLLIPAVASIITIFVLTSVGQAITIFHVMALFLVLGLGMDYIIFAKEMSEERNITQQAILLSAVTSLLSFGLLAFSSMPVVQAFGSTILIGNTINFIAAISLFNRPQTQLEGPQIEQ